MPLVARLSKMATTPLSQIPTLAILYKLGRLEPSESPKTNATTRYNDKISLIRMDITKLEVDAIVNAANESLLGGGGVDGAIHRAAGPKLLDECETLDGCDTGDAKITDAYRLPSRKIMHAVGPVYRIQRARGLHTTLLQSCYTRALDLAAENECKSIAFSAISTGVYGYPSEEAAETAIDAVKGWLEQDEERAERMERVIFCSFMEKDEAAYNKYIPRFFPPSPDVSEGEQDEATAKDDSKVEDGESSIPPLPDVPTQEPGAEDEQPERKKARLDVGAAENKTPSDG